MRSCVLPLVLGLLHSGMSFQKVHWQDSLLKITWEISLKSKAKERQNRTRAKCQVLFAATVSSDKLWWHRNPKTDTSTLSGHMPILPIFIFLVLISVRWGWWIESHVTTHVTEIIMSSANNINGIESCVVTLISSRTRKEKLCLNSFPKNQK